MLQNCPRSMSVVTCLALISFGCSSGTTPPSSVSSAPPASKATSTLPPAAAVPRAAITQTIPDPSATSSSSAPPRAVVSPSSSSVPTPAAAVAAARWGVKPDPLPISVELKIDPKASIAVPAGGEILFPSTASAFVVVGKNSQPTDVRELWNLQTMKREGAIQGKLDHSLKIVISPDGRYLAGRMTITRNAGVEIWSL